MSTFALHFAALLAATPAASSNINDKEAHSCSCEAIASLQLEVATLRAEVQRAGAVDEGAVRRLVRELVATALEDTTRVSSLDDTGASAHEPHASGARRLSSATTYVSVPSRQVHAFPPSHTCSSVSGYMQALPVQAAGGVSWKPSPSDVTSEISFASVASDWSTTEIARSPAPLVLEHDASCAAPPALRIGLNTSVESLAVTGTLTVNGVAVGGGAPALQWTALTGAGTNAILSTSHSVPSYAVSGGMLYLQGLIFKGSADWAYGDVLATLPAAARPARSNHLVLVSDSTTPAVKAKLMSNNGELQLQTFTSGFASSIWLDGVSLAMSGA